MKVKRYHTGQQVVGKLKEQRSRMLSPEEAASAAGAKYNAIADVAGTASEALTRIQEVKNKTIDADDRVKKDRQIQEAIAQRKRLKLEIENDPNRGADEYETGMQEIIKGLTDAGGNISERNRATYMEEIGGWSNIVLQDVMAEGNIMRANKARETLESSVDLSIQNDEFDAARMQINMGVEEGLIGEEAKVKAYTDIDSRQKGKELGAGYKAAVANGTTDAFMNDVGNADYDDATLNYFGQEKKQVDLFADQVEAKVRTEQTLEYNDYKATVSSQTDPETMKAWIRERPWLNDDKINSLYSQLKKGEETKVVLNDIYSDRDAKGVREAANSELDTTQPPENVAQQAAAFTSRERIVPTAFTNMVNNLSSTESPNDLIEAGQYVMLMEESSPGVNLHLNDLTQAKTTMYIDMVKRKVDPVAAATTVNNHYAGVTEQVVDARKAKYETEGYGPDNLSPKQFINDELTRRLSDTDTPLGAAFAGDMGEGWFNREDAYGKDTVTMSPLMEDTLGTLAYNFYIAGASEEVAIESALRAIRNQGFAGTDINYDIAWSGDEKYQFQIQQNPITRVGNKPIPAIQVRDMIQQDIKDIQYLRVNDPVGAKPRNISINDIYVGDGIVDEIEGPNKGNLKWPLMSGGSQLTVNGQPQYWWYEPQKGTPQQDAEEDNPVVTAQQRTADSMQSQMTGGIL